MASQLAAAPPPADKVLVIGGTQFMGVHTVEALRRAGYAVTVLNRGRSAWPFDDGVAHVAADRFADRAVVKRTITEGGPWAAVVDFVAFAKTHARDVVLSCCLCSPKPRYVYVSSDSVFMACRRAPLDARRAAGDPLVEADAVRETARAGVAACKKRDASVLPASTPSDEMSLHLSSREARTIPREHRAEAGASRTPNQKGTSTRTAPASSRSRRSSPRCGDAGSRPSRSGCRT